LTDTYYSDDESLSQRKNLLNLWSWSAL